MMRAAVAGMSRPRKARKRPREPARGALPADAVAEVPRARLDMRHFAREVGDDGAVRYRSLGSGLRVLDAEVSGGGIVVGRALQNTLECKLDSMYQLGLLADPRDPEAESRRYLAGLEVRRLYEEACIGDAVTPSYDKMSGITMPGGGAREKSDHADRQEARYHRLMRAVRPYDTVVGLVSRDEHVEERLREALRRGLDAAARDLWGGPRPRVPRGG